jgi:alkyl sulfatase BDS1-like metallo-beta-lactamase superfamily hydrolase
MRGRLQPSLSVVLLLLGAGLGACQRRGEDRVAPGPAAESVHPVLEAHTAEFERRVYEVTEGVYVAVGFGLANSILVEGDECVFVVDVMASNEAAEAVRAAFEQITHKPIAALVYTHNHADHVFGGRGFVPDGDVAVYAHDTTSAYIDRLINVLRPAIGRRSERMFGNHLPRQGPDRFVNAGIGPGLEIGHGGGTPSLLRPNHTFADVLEVQLCGLDVEMVHAPGETSDQIFVWLPSRRVLMPGDNVYKAFPNLYTIRGTPYRDVREWVRSIDKMRALGPEHLVPSHTRPVSGGEQVAEILTTYRDGIQYVHDQTIRGINQGLTPDELVETVRLPPQLASHPYLQELYGTVEWSVRSIFTGYLGWFDGDTATLSPAGPDARATGFVELAGGVDALLEATRRAVAEGRHAWAAELASQLMRFDPDLGEARRLKSTALRALGRAQISPNGRNYYLTQALELAGEVEVGGFGVDEGSLDIARAIPIGNFISAMPVYLDPEKSADRDTVMGFRFPDVDEAYTLHVRRGIAEVRAGFPEDRDLAISAPAPVWIEIVAGIRSLPAAMATGAVEVEGGVARVPAVLRFLALFRQ